MTIEEKQLLLKDLCARLPYGVIIQEYNEEYGYADNALNTIGIGYFSIHEACIEGTWINHIENIKPYLRPMSSITKEELFEVQDIIGKGVEIRDSFISIVDSSINSLSYLELQALFEWFLKNHFDFMDLIPKNLAIEVTKDNNPYK